MSIFNKPYLFTQLRLQNFMMHQDTTILLGDYPIILITGANGSGKTQILDGLILALGYHPKRLRKGKVSDLIGSWDKVSQITLKLFNPLCEGSRLIPISNKILSSFLNSDHFEIQVTIDSNSDIDYSLTSSIGHKKLNRKEVREIFDSIGVRADNKLAFTEEGTVNIFADNSSKSKLDLLLDTTGLTSYRENLLTALDSLEKAANSIEPLRRKYQIEQEYLQSMEKTKKLMSQKSAMIRQHEQLLLEEIWQQVVIVEKESKGLQDTITTKQEELKEKKAVLQECEDQKDSIQENLKKITFDYDEQRKTIEKKQSRLRNLDGQNQSNQRMLQKNQQKIAELEKRYEEAIKTAEQKELRNNLESELHHIDSEKQRMASIRQRLSSTFVDAQFSTERQLLQQCLEFEKECKRQNLAVSSCILAELQMRKDWTFEQQQSWISLLGRYIFGFIALDDSAWQKGQTILKEHWPQYPAIWFFKKPSQENLVSLESSNLPVENLVKQESQNVKESKNNNFVWHFLQNYAKFVVAIPENFSKFWDANQNLDHTVFYENKIYLPYSGVGVSKSSQFLEACLALSWEELTDALQFSQNYKKLLEREQQVKLQLDSLNNLSNIRNIQERLIELKHDNKNLETEIEVNIQEAEEINENIAEISQKYGILAEQVEQLKQNIREKQQQILSLNNEIINLERILTTLTRQEKELQDKLEKATKEAENKGKRPEEIRSLKIITEERLHLEGQLASLKVTTLSEEEYNIQKQKVEKLEAEISGSSNHLGNLKNDMTTRFEKWHQEVLAQIANISDTMNQLLSFMIQGVRLRIDNLRNPNNAGLEIEIKRHTNRWHDLSQLSGGEKVLAVEALIMSLHLQTDSPLHAIDECTQRLDLQFKAQALEMVRQAVLQFSTRSNSRYAPQFILLTPDTLGIEFNGQDSCFRRVVLGPSQFVN